jgi:hypothetical protein
MAANPDLMAAVVKVRQRLHRRFWSNAQQQVDHEFKALQRKISPQRVFDLSSEKFRVSRSRSLDKKKLESKLDPPLSLPIPRHPQVQISKPESKLGSQEKASEENVSISCRERIEVYEAIILKLSKNIQSLKRENSSIKTKEQQIKNLEQRLAHQTVTKSLIREKMRV